jgi:hypothetical protein
VLALSCVGKLALSDGSGSSDAVPGAGADARRALALLSVA